MSEAQITPIQIPFPNAAGFNLIFELNGVRLEIHPSQQETWVTGQSSYKRPPAPVVEQVGGEVKIKQEYVRSELTNMFRLAGDSPVMDVQISTQQSYNLTVDSLGDHCELDLGGIPLKNVNLILKLGQGQINFSAPHPSQMGALTLEAQAAQMEIQNLGQAETSQILVKGHSSTFNLLWGTGLNQDCTLELRARETPTTLVLPTNIAVKIRAEDGVFSSDDIEFSADQAFSLHLGEYWTQAAINGQTPVLTVIVSKLGPLAVRSS